MHIGEVIDLLQKQNHLHSISTLHISTIFQQVQAESHDVCLNTLLLMDVHNSKLKNTYVKILITFKNRDLYLHNSYNDIRELELY